MRKSFLKSKKPAEDSWCVLFILDKILANCHTYLVKHFVVCNSTICGGRYIALATSEKPSGIFWGKISTSELDLNQAIVSYRASASCPEFQWHTYVDLKSASLNLPLKFYLWDISVGNLGLKENMCMSGRVHPQVCLEGTRILLPLEHSVRDESIHPFLSWLEAYRSFLPSFHEKHVWWDRQCQLKTCQLFLFKRALFHMVREGQTTFQLGCPAESTTNGSSHLSRRVCRCGARSFTEGSIHRLCGDGDTTGTVPVTTLQQLPLAQLSLEAQQAPEGGCISAAQGCWMFGASCWNRGFSCAQEVYTEGPSVSPREGVVCRGQEYV